MLVRLCGRLVLIGHALRWHRILTAHALLLLSLHVLLIRHLLLLFGSDVVLRHAAPAVAGHVWLRGGNLRVVDFFGRIDVGLAVDSIFTPLWRFGRIETRLEDTASQKHEWVETFDPELTWIRFLPSALVTRGWSLGVVKV